MSFSAFLFTRPCHRTTMHRFFTQTKYASFQRQLNLYGFRRFSRGKDKGAYYHLCFVKDHRLLVTGMVRCKIKGTKVRPSVDEEPNFYHEAWTNHFEASIPPALRVRSVSPVESQEKSYVVSRVINSSPIPAPLPLVAVSDSDESSWDASLDDLALFNGDDFAFDLCDMDPIPLEESTFDPVPINVITVETTATPRFYMEDPFEPTPIREESFYAPPHVASL